LLPPSSPLDRLIRSGPLIGLALISVLAAVMYGHVFAGEIVGDDNTFHLAEATRLADCLRAGDFDLWNPSANAGYASAYYYQAVPQLVPAVLATLTGTDVLPWFQLFVFLPLVLAPAAAYRGMRMIGTGPWPALGAAFAILTCASNNRWGFGADGTFTVGLYTQTWALAMFPLVLGYSIRWIRDGVGLGAAVGWGVLCGVCHPFAGFAIGVALIAGAGTVLICEWLGPLVRKETGPWLARIDHAIFGSPRDGEAAGEAPPSPLRIKPLLIRLTVLGALLLIGAASAWLPVLVDYEGFGGFPHRVWDEVGPGFVRLWDWMIAGNILDCASYGNRWRVLTVLLPVALIAGRDRALPWLWGASLAFAFLLGLGPNLPTAGGDDLLPLVRFLGVLQISLALAIGAGTVQIGIALWRRASRLPDPWLLVAQAVIASAATLIVVSLALTSVQIAHARVRVATDLEHIHRDQIRAVADAIADQPEGRKQARKGTENHFFNLLPYVDARVPALFQMGGAGLQSSPNYDFLWNVGDPRRTAWVFDAPYLTFANASAAEMPEGELVLETENFTVRRLPAPGLMSPVELAATPLPAERFAARKAGIAWLKSDAAMEDKLIAYAGFPGLATAPHGQVLDVKRQDSPGDDPDIVAAVRADQPTTFVLRESWHPRWHAFVDGRPIPVRRVTPDFVAVDIPVGEHAVTFRFDRPWWAWAIWLLLVLAPLAGWRLGPRIGRLGTGVKAPRPVELPPARLRPPRSP
jgi:hypothetical protein